MVNKRVLIVDDDVKIVELVKLYMNREGYAVQTAYDGKEALRLAREIHPDLIVLDIMLPGIDGLEICRVLRSESTVSIILLTANTTEQDRITLDLGVDDYVTKPFSPKELAARVRVVFRCTSEEVLQMGTEELHFGNLTVNFVKHEAYLSSKALNLTPVEFKLLVVLVREPSQVFSRAQLIERVLGSDFDGFDRIIDSYILNLRRKLEPDISHPKYIKTVCGSGYEFTGGNK